MTTKTVALHRPHTHHLSPFGAWLHKYHRVFDWAGLLVIIVSGLSVAAQLLYPQDRALPFASIGGIVVGGENRTELVTHLSDYAASGDIVVATSNKQWRAKWQEIGLAVDSEASAEVAINYPTWERLIPFSGLIKVLQSQNQPLVAIVEKEQLRAFASQVVIENKLAARDATIKVVNGIVVVNPAAEGYVFKSESVASQVQSTAMIANSRLQLVPDSVPYRRPAAELETLRLQAEALLGKSLKLAFAGKIYEPTPTDMGKWLEFNENPTTKQIGLSLNNAGITKYLEAVDSQAGITPGSSTVTLLDGQEIARTPAASGRTTASTASLRAIKAALLSDKKEATINLSVVSAGPKLTYIRTYSKTDKGLLAVIKDWKTDYPGNSSILVRELNGKKRFAAITPDTVYVPASTFKLFVYYGVATKITSGAITYNTVNDMGWTINDCLEEMIVHSTNPCAISFMNLMGWQWTEDNARAAGFSHTYLNNYGGGEKHTTLRDETNYLLRLYFGRLMAKEPSERLLGYMKRQVWRAGIPSGVPGVTVANKVGRYNGWLHDVAIVYGPESNYILGVMTRYYDYSDFAELSRRVYNFLQN